MLDTNDLVVHLSPEIGALQRLLNTLRRRGFAVDSMDARRLDDDGYRVEVRVDNLRGGSRSVEALAKHIGNLVDVRSVSVLGSALRQVHAYGR